MEPRIMLDRTTLQQRLAALEAEVPALLRDRDAFARAFEDRVELLWSQWHADDEAAAWQALEAIIARSRFNA